MMKTLLLCQSFTTCAQEFVQLDSPMANSTYRTCIERTDEFNRRIGAIFYDRTGSAQAIDTALDIFYENIRDLPNFNTYMVPESIAAYNCFIGLSGVADKRTLKLFLNKGFNPSFKAGSNRYSAIEVAALNGNIEAIETFLEPTADGRSATKPSFSSINTLLCIATYYRDVYMHTDAAETPHHRFFAARAISIARNRGRTDAHEQCLEIMNLRKKEISEREKRLKIQRIKRVATVLWNKLCCCYKLPASDNVYDPI